MIRHDKMAYSSIYSDNREYNRQERYTVGFIDFIKWNCLSYRRPEKGGRYYTSDAEGHVRKLYVSDYDSNPIYQSIFPIESKRLWPRWSDGKKLTNEEIVDICSQYDVWYDFEDVIDYGEYCGSRITIITAKDLPVYWADFSELVGPTEYDRKHSPIHIESYK